MILVPEDVFVRVKLPLPWLLVSHWNHALDTTSDELLIPTSVRDDLLHRDDLDLVLFGEPFKVGHARHGPIRLHQLGDHAGGIQPGQDGKVYGALRLTRAGQHAALGGT